ncbi:molecular chaperone [Pantoea sp. 1.19]|uniref:fimbrial biogenesis chaperone n=1 Tax=Pantoea sp. 1.19 TaxID=1925589 RepID=UPI000948A08F|nr:molecular chaperone [Pantoea sp. 1.19]
MEFKTIRYAVAALLCCTQAVFAGVEIGGSRVVYDGNLKQASISINNPDDKPYLIQSWVNQQLNSDDNDDTFIATPPLFRLEPHSQNSIRIMYTGKPLPQDKESVLWLNIKSIPSTRRDAQNQLLITVKNKMKLFYRPAGLSGDPASAYQKIVFRQRHGQLYAFNPTPYSISFYDIHVNGSAVNKPGMVLPQQELPLQHGVAPGARVSWRAINDFGGITAPQDIKMSP